MRIKNLINYLFSPTTSPFWGEIKRGASLQYLYSLIAPSTSGRGLRGGASLIILLAACSNTNPQSGNPVAESNFELKGKLSNAHGETIYLQLMDPSGIKGIDTVVVDEKGEFAMTAEIKEAGFFRLGISEKNFATLILDANQKVTFIGDASAIGNNYQVSGSPDSKLFLEINQASTINYHKRDSLQAAFQAYMSAPSTDPNKAAMLKNTIEGQYNALVAEHNKFLQTLIEKNTGSLASLAAIQQLPVEDFLETYIKADNGLFAKYPKSAYIKAFHEDVLSKKKLAIGSPAPEISLNGPDGKGKSLSSLKGKIVLVDFWASWCAPCRAENPNVVKAYNKYKSKGFEIFSVSLDSEGNKWKAAIQKDNLSWDSHVCDLLGWKSPVVPLYSFQGIPYNVLIDKEGKIIAKNLRGEDLEKKLAEVFK